MSRETHQVAMVVLVDAEGVDYHDASAGARMALDYALRQMSDPTLQDMPSSLEPVCDECGLDAGLTQKGLVRSHYPGEHIRLRRAADRCPGAYAPPRVQQQPIVGFLRGRDKLRIAARVYDVIEMGMAMGNGYTWTRPTRRGFRA